MKKQFMFDFTLPEVLTDQFMALIPAQRQGVNDLMASGTIMSYTLSSDRRKLWVVVKADTDTEAIEAMAELPLTEYMKMDFHEVMFHNTVQVISMPIFSDN